MKLSVFTPTHNPKYLAETYQSLKLQDIQDWEWVIVVNGEDTRLPSFTSADSRIRIIDDCKSLYNIGAIKRRAVGACTGDVFIELDHDDVLVPKVALTAIRNKFLEGADFVYSDTALFRYADGAKQNFQPHIFDTRYGWQNYPITVYGTKLQASRCFDISPRSLAEIYFCPDHVRCWSRKAYYESGGHNPELSVCDDHELMIKTYLAGFKFAHTGGCHYLYRLHQNNTVNARNKQIQEITAKLKERHLPTLINRWLINHDLHNLDIAELKKTGWKWEYALQGFGENNFGHIYCDNELQALEGWQVTEFLNEAYRALVPGGYLTIIVPDAVSGAGYINVNWKSHFSRFSFLPYTDREHTYPEVRCRFQEVNCSAVYKSTTQHRQGIKYWKFELVALKGQRHPGLQLI